MTTMLIDRRRLVQWLLTHGFRELKGNGSGHRHFERGSLKVAVPGHGRNDLRKEVLSKLLRTLEAAGFSRRTMREELGV
jgi:predicted RNA binding protein YcfA (HicA-like mRNA interferase family)